LLAQGDHTTVSVGLFAEVISYNGTALAILKLWNMVLVSGSERSGLRNGDCVSNLVSGVVVSFARAVAQCYGRFRGTSRRFTVYVNGFHNDGITYLLVLVITSDYI
jgi:hypothetical protein